MMRQLLWILSGTWQAQPTSRQRWLLIPMLGGLLLLFHPPAHSDRFLTVDSSIQQQVITQHLKYWRQPLPVNVSRGTINFKSPFDIHQALQLPHSAWTPLTGNPNFGFSHHTYWFKTRLTATTDFEGALEIDRPMIDIVNVYIVESDGHIQRFQLGDYQPTTDKPLYRIDIQTPLTFSAGKSYEIYLQVNSRGLAVQFQPTIKSARQADKDNSYKTISFSALGGAALLMSLYNLFLYLSTRQRSYLYYSMMVLAYVGGWLSVGGFIQHYFHPEQPELTPFFVGLGSIFSRIFACLFILSFLRLRKRRSPMRFIFYTHILIEIVCLAIPFLQVTELAPLVVINSVVLYFSALLVTLHHWLKGHSSTSYMSLAWAFYAIANIIYFLSLGGHIDYKPGYVYTLMLATAAEMVLLTLALADRMNINRLDQQRLIETEQQTKTAQQQAMTQQAQALAEQTKALDSSRANLESKDAFLTAISHELRTPMNAIIGGLQSAQSNRQQPLPSPYDIVQRGADEMMQLINDILNYTEINSSKLTNNQRASNSHSIFRDLYEHYQPQCQHKQLRINWDVEQNLPEWLQLDDEKLQTICAKLLDNAIKFTQRGYISLHVRYAEQEHHGVLLLEIKDSGIGMRKADQQHIFEAFHQNSQGLQRRFDGMGIGLTICQNLLLAVDGTIDIDSTRGIGTTIRLSIPTRQTAAPAIQTSPTRQAGSQYPVLLVEDNVVNQQVMRKMLEKLGLTSIVANHGREALDVLISQPVSLVLMDLQMPEMDGYTCTQHIRANDEKLPIIAVTANLMDTDIQQLKAIGMDDFLKKPVKLDQLRRCLEPIVEHPLTS